jgi:hypothetical protein
MVTMVHQAFDRSGVKPRNLDEALALPVCVRSAYAERDQMLGHELQPGAWPEVLAVREALAAAQRRPERPFGAYPRDSGLAAIVALYAAGYVQRDLVRAATHLPSTAWWVEGGRQRGLSSLSAEVVRRALDELPEERTASPEVLRAIAAAGEA